MKNKNLIKIEKEIKTIKKHIIQFDIFRPGSITRQYSKPDKKSGGFYQLSYSHQGKGRTEYVRAKFLDRTRQQALDYKDFKQLMDRWVELGIEYCKLEISLDVEEGKNET
jgi:hypothetical protein